VLITDVPLALLFFLVVFIHCRPLPLQCLHYHIHAVVRILHDQLELLSGIAVVSPYEGDTVGVVEVTLDSLESREGEPADEAAHVLKLVVGFKDEEDLRAVRDYDEEVTWLGGGRGGGPLAGEHWGVVVRLPD
jgi:hypothetical protein